MMTPMFTRLCLAVTVAAALAGGGDTALANSAKDLPELGDASSAMVSPEMERRIGEDFLKQLHASAPTVDDPLLWKVALGCMQEAYRAGVAKQVNFSFTDPVDYVSRFGRNMPDAKPSMLQDHYARRPSEIDAINGMVPKLGRELDIATPYNDSIVAAVIAREQDFTG